MRTELIRISNSHIQDIVVRFVTVSRVFRVGYRKICLYLELRIPNENGELG